MTLYTDIPTRSEIDALWEAGPRAAISLYLETRPDSSGEAERIAYKNAVREALSQLDPADLEDLAGLADELTILEDEEADDFWRYQARTLAVFATPSSLHTFRLPNRLTPAAVGGSRFLVRPLLRAVTFPQTAYVLALAQGSVRLLETLPEIDAREVRLPGMPADVASAVGKSSIRGRSPIRRVQGSEGQKLRMAQYARLVDGGLRGMLSGQSVPLVVAATEPLASIFRAHCSYPHLVPRSVASNPEGRGDGELVAAAREVLDGWYADQLEEQKARFVESTSQGRASSDVADVARFATRGAVESLFLDIDTALAGGVDERGEVTFSEYEGASDVLDEIARRAWLSGARLFAIRKEDMPGGASVAATLRYAPAA